MTINETDNCLTDCYKCLIPSYKCNLLNRLYIKVLKLSYMTVLQNVNDKFAVLYEKYLLKGS